MSYPYTSWTHKNLKKASEYGELLLDLLLMKKLGLRKVMNQKYLLAQKKY